MSSQCDTTANVLDLSLSRDVGPKQPLLSKYPQSECGKQKRSFCSSWYERFPFIEYSVQGDSVFCFICRHFPSRSTKSDPSFVTDGFKKWKKFTSIVEKHVNCDSHALSMTYYSSWKSAKTSGSVVFQLDSHADRVIISNRDVVTTLSRIGILCARHGIALRGHRKSDSKSNQGNFLNILQMIELENKEFAQKLKTLPKNTTYSSKDSQNDILEAAAAVVLDEICSEIKAAPCYAVFADEARDISRSEQMSVCIRYLKGSQICERFIEFVSMHDFGACSLCTEIVNVFERGGFVLNKCVAQCYDGASVMSGKNAGVQALLREQCQSPSLYVQCHAHRLNLVLVDCCSDIQILGDVIGIMEAIYCFFTASVKRHDLFKQSQNTAGLQVFELPQQSDTR